MYMVVGYLFELVMFTLHVCLDFDQRKHWNENDLRRAEIIHVVQKKTTSVGVDRYVPHQAKQHE